MAFLYSKDLTTAPLEVTFFVVVKSLEYKNAISANFVQTVENLITRPKCLPKFNQQKIIYIRQTKAFYQKLQDQP